jgi:hypothetical protein
MKGKNKKKKKKKKEAIHNKNETQVISSTENTTLHIWVSVSP